MQMRAVVRGARCVVVLVFAGWKAIGSRVWSGVRVRVEVDKPQWPPPE